MRRALLAAQDTLCETAYLADVAGLQYDVSGEGLSGLDVKLHGFSDKLPALTDTVFKALAGFQVDPLSAQAIERIPACCPVFFNPATARWLPLHFSLGSSYACCSSMPYLTF